jgi:plasmid maintenance system antidote protein VapI
MKSPRQFAPVEKHIIATYLVRQGWEETDVAKWLGVSPNRLHKILRDPRFTGLTNIHIVPQTVSAVRH